MPSMWASIGLNIEPFKRGVSDARNIAKQAGSHIGSDLLGYAGQATAGFGIAELLRETLESAEHIRELSLQFRVSTDTIQKWQKGAKEAGMTAEDIGGAFNRLKRAREEAVTKGDVGAFGNFGIGMEDLKNSALSTEEIMDRIRTAAASHPITDSEDVAGMELMGKSGARILSALEQIHKLGPIKIISKQEIDELHEATETLEEAKRQAIIGTAQTLGVFGTISQTPGVGLGWWSKVLGRQFESAKQLITGQASPDQAVDVLLGRTTKPEVKKINEGEGGTSKPLSYSITKTVDLHKDDAEIAKLKAQLDEKALEVAMKLATTEERRAMINQQIAEHKRKSIEARFGEGDEVTALKEDLKVTQLEGQLSDTDKKGARHAPDVNSLQRIGAYASGPDRSLATLTQQNGHKLDGIRHGIDQLVKESKRGKF